MNHFMHFSLWYVAGFILHNIVRRDVANKSLAKLYSHKLITNIKKLYY